MKALHFQVYVEDDVDTSLVDGSKLTHISVADLRKFLQPLPQKNSLQPLSDNAIVNIAEGIEQRAYRNSVKGFAEDVRNEIKAGNITDSDGAREYLEQSIDGAHDVIYIYAAQNVCRFSDNDTAYFDQMGSEGAVSDSGIEWSKLAYFALLQDVLDELGDLDELFTDDDDEDSDTTEEV